MTEIVSNVEHSHAPDYDYIQALKVRCTMKSTAKTNHGKPSQIVTDAFHEFPPAVIVASNVNKLLQNIIYFGTQDGKKNSIFPTIVQIIKLLHCLFYI